MKEEEKKELVTISIALDPEVIQKLEDGHYNKSKLIDSLLAEYFNKNKQRIIPNVSISETEPLQEGISRKPIHQPPPDRILKEGEQPTPPKNKY